ncbi:MAG: hypothetical protein ACWA5K_07305 [bacterium]
MHPFLPFAAIPAIAAAAWFAADNWSGGDPRRFHVPTAAKVENPSVVTRKDAGKPDNADILVKAFLPHIPPKPPEAEPTLILHSILAGAKVKVATINGKIVQEGDVVEGYRVKRITSEGVDLARSDSRRRLAMVPLHELPPPKAPPEVSAADRLQRNKEVDLTEDFWKIFDSLKP